ncbi:MAG: sugar phosphate isomerase/epimerase [Pseudomonadota bacterium]
MISEKTPPNLSYQLYSSRNFGPLIYTIGMLVELGYDEVEGYGGLFEDEVGINDLEAVLGRTGLEMTSAHFGLDQVEGDSARMVGLAKRFGMRAVFVPYLDEADRPTDAAGWISLGKRLSELSKPFQDAGIDFGWHNHDFEFTALGTGEMPIDLIFEGGPDLAFEFDIAWAFVAGQDPSAWIDKHAERLKAAHLKDRAPSGQKIDEDGWADFGAGVMEWRTLTDKLLTLGVPTLVMEHDNPSDDRRFAEASLDNFQSFLPA